MTEFGMSETGKTEYADRHDRLMQRHAAEIKELDARHAAEKEVLNARHYEQRIALYLEFPDNPKVQTLLYAINQTDEGRALIEKLRPVTQAEKNIDYLNSLLEGAVPSLLDWWETPLEELGGLAPIELGPEHPTVIEIAESIYENARP